MLMNRKNRVYIARTDGLQDDSVFNRLYQAASPDRRRKTDALVFRKDKMLSLAAEALLKIALHDNGVTDDTIVYGENGKPYLRSREIFFSLSHCAETVMCAVSQGEIGADTEKVTDIDLDVAKRFFHPEEYAMLQRLETEGERQNLFFRLWTLKESFLKAMGTGLLLPTDSFRIVMEGGEISVAQPFSRERFYFKEYELNDGYQYSVCGMFAQFEDNPQVISLK